MSDFQKFLTSKFFYIALTLGGLWFANKAARFLFAAQTPLKLTHQQEQEKELLKEAPLDPPEDDEALFMSEEFAEIRPSWEAAHFQKTLGELVEAAAIFLGIANEMINNPDKYPPKFNSLIRTSIILSAESFFDAGMPERSLFALNVFPQSCLVTVTDQIMFHTHLQKYCIAINHPETYKIIDKSVSLITQQFGADSPFMASQFVAYGVFNKRNAKFEEATNYFREGVSCMENAVNKLTEVDDIIIAQLLELYNHWQGSLILSGDDETAEQIQQELTERFAEQSPLIFFRHMLHYATCFVESGNDKLAVQVHNSMGEFAKTHQQFFKSSPALYSIFSDILGGYLMQGALITANQTNDYNLDNRFMASFWKLKSLPLSSSRFFKTSLAKVCIRPVGQNDWEADVKFVLRLKHVDAGKHVKITYEIPGEEEVFDMEVKSTFSVLADSRKPRKNLPSPGFRALVQLYEDSSMEKLLYTHWQFFKVTAELNDSMTFEDIRASFQKKSGN